MQVLAAMAVMSISFYFLSSYVISQRKQVVKTKNVVNLKFAVNSAMDYVVFGIRQKYCFENGSLLNNTTSCNWLHAGNVERLLMSDEQVASLTTMAQNGVDIGPRETDITKLALKRIDLMMDFPVSTGHPLFPIVQSLKSVTNETDNKSIDVKGAQVTLRRPENAGYLPTSGREVYITAEVSLVDSKNKVIEIGSAPLTIRSQIVVYPRELGSFALVLPGNLRMDRAWDAAKVKQDNPGDVYFHKFTNRTELSSSPGLVFLSPVFVNANIYLPPDSGKSANSNYSAVTFAERVYMGNGWVYDSSGSLYAPTNAGGVGERLWSDSRVFGGFLRGIENDGQRDSGLDVLSGFLTNVPSGSDDLNKKCAERNLNSESLENMANSKAKAGGLSTTLVDAGSGRTMYQYELGLSNQNNFVAQKNYIDNPDTDRWKKIGSNQDAYVYRDNKGETRGGIANVTIAYGSGSSYKEVSTDLVRDGYIEVEPPVVNATRRQELVNTRTSEIAKRDALKATGENLSSEKASLDKQVKEKDVAISEKKILINNEMSKPVYKAPEESNGTGTGTENGNSNGNETEEGSGSESGGGSGSGSGGTSTVQEPVDMSKYRDQALIDRLNSEIDQLRTDMNNLQAKADKVQYTDIPANRQQIANADTVVDGLSAQIADYDKMVKEKPKIRVDLDNILNWAGRAVKDKMLIQNFFEHMENLRDEYGNHITNVSIRVQGYDGTFWNSEPISDKIDANHLVGYFNYKFDKNGKPTLIPTGLAANPNSTGEETVVDSNDALDDECRKRRDYESTSSFLVAGWGQSFLGGTRKSWNFAGVTGTATSDPIVATREFGNDEEFKVYSIIGNCIVPPTTTFITGFYNCDNMEIKGGRTAPLRIIGTVIIGKSLIIDQQAIKTGISWSTIYHPQATAELRAKGILRPLSAPDDIAKCDKLPSPIWHPLPSIQETADRMACNVISLRAKADPFKWTTVDPDCGFAEGAAKPTTSCKKRVVKYLVVEQSREGSGL